MNATSTIFPAKLGKYEVRREIGRGGMGVVYEGFDPVIDRRVALKTLKAAEPAPTQGSHPDTLLARLKREAQAAGRLTHPHIVAVYDFGEEKITGADGVTNDTAFIAMEYVEGRELSSYFADNRRFPSGEIVRIMSELLDALEYSHSHGVVHRDIKPANVILLKDGFVKIADFGIARIDSSTLTQEGTVLGSPNYMSPEQFMGQTVDGRSDLYSAAVVLYQLLTGDVPFNGSFATLMHKVINEEATPPSAVNVQVPKAFDAVLRRAMAKRPDERYQTAAELKAAIIAADAKGPAIPAEFTAMTTVTTQPAPTSPPKPTSIARSDALAGIMMAVFGIGAAGYLYWSRHTGGAEPVVAAIPAATHAAESHVASESATTHAETAPVPATSTPMTPSSTGPASTTAATPSGSSGGMVASNASAPANPGVYVISAVGLAEPQTAGNPADNAQTEKKVWEDARRQLISKAAALYVDPASMKDHYEVLRTKLLSRSGDFIQNVVDQQPATVSKYGLMLGTMRASVKVRDVQKSLNEISREQRVDFIRNNGDPRISINIRSYSSEADPMMGPERSAVAENLLGERIRSFGFVVVDGGTANPPEEFRVDGEVRFKRLSMILPASGVPVTKYAITSWTVKATDAMTGEVIYNNTALPLKKSWASEELAMQDVGRMIGGEFSKQFFLRYYNFAPTKIQVRFSGLPVSAWAAVAPEIDASLQVLNTGPARQEGGDVVVDADLSGGSAAPADVITTAVIMPLNRKLGRNCFNLASGDASVLRIGFDAGCTPALNKLESSPPAALIDAPTQRIEEVVKDPRILNRVKT